MIDGLRPYEAYRRAGVPWLGEVPAHWATPRLKAVFREVDHRSGTGAEPLLSLRMQQGLVDHHAMGGKPIPPSNLINYKRTEPGEIVMNRMRAAVGLFAATPSVGLVSPDYAVLRPRTPVALQYFVHLFRTPQMMSVFRVESHGLGTGESGFLRLYTERFGMLAAPVPPLDEQAAIVRFLDHADRRIRRYIRAKQKLIKLLEEQKQAIIHRAVTRGLDHDVRFSPSGVEWLGEVPAHWELRKLRHGGHVVGGLTPSMEDRELWDGDIPWVTPKDMKRPEIADSSMRVAKAAIEQTGLRLIPAPAVLLVVRGMILARRVPIARTTAPVTINQDMKALIPSPEIDAAFLASVLDCAQVAFAPLIDEAGHGTRRLPTERWREITIPVPPVAEQTAITRFLGAATARIAEGLTRVARQVELLREYRTRLVAEVVTGKLDVREAAARLPEVPEEQEPPDETEASAEGDDEVEDAESEQEPEDVEA